MPRDSAIDIAHMWSSFQSIVYRFRHVGFVEFYFTISAYRDGLPSTFSTRSRTFRDTNNGDRSLDAGPRKRKTIFVVVRSIESSKPKIEYWKRSWVDDGTSKSTRVHRVVRIGFRRAQINTGQRTKSNSRRSPTLSFTVLTETPAAVQGRDALGRRHRRRRCRRVSVAKKKKQLFWTTTPRGRVSGPVSCVYIILLYYVKI